MVKDDKTVFDPGATKRECDETIYENTQTMPDTAATQPDDDSMTVAALSDAEKRADVTASNLSIQRGDSILDTYKVESDAIEGGMGSVWRVHHTLWNTDLAMKRPQPQCFATEKSKADFIHECEAWINLGLHPNIVSCYYVREISGTPSIFSEWMDGGSLESAIKNETLYEGKEAEQRKRILDIAIQFARGLNYAHDAGLIHQDVKPDNLLLSKDGDAKVADFGLAKARAVLTVAENVPNVLTSTSIGMTIASPSGGYTPAYCSMEQMDGKELTRRTDIYSWAVSVMEMYIGSRPWMNGVVAGLSCRGYFEDTRIPVPEALRELLAKCMEAEPNDRPHNFAEIETELLKIYRAEIGSPYPRPAPKAAANTADSLNNRALSMLDLGKPEEAEALWQQAIRTDSSRFIYHYNYAIFLWNRCKISDSELYKRFQAQKERGTLWERAMELYTQMHHGKATDGCAVLSAADELLVPSSISTDGRRHVTGYYDRGIYGYRIEDTTTGITIDYPNNIEDLGESTPRDGQTYMHAHYLKSDKARFVGSSSEVVAVEGDVLWLFDAKNGRLLKSLPPIYDSDGDTLGYELQGYTNKGVIKYRNVFTPLSSYSLVSMPDACIEFPFELAKITSTLERIAAQTNVEKHYREAAACFASEDYQAAFLALNKSFEDNTLTSHEPSLRLWTALGEHLIRGKLSAVVPTCDPPSALPRRSTLNNFAFAGGREPIALIEKNKNKADNGQTAVTIDREEDSEYDTCMDRFEYMFSYSLSACDMFSGNIYFRIESLLCDSWSDEVVPDRDLYLEFLGESSIRMFKKSWRRSEEIDLCNMEYQIDHRLKFMLPGGYELYNTRDGVSIGGFEFDDVFDDFCPMWNADIIGCKKQNYRLVYQYILSPNPAT